MEIKRTLRALILRNTLVRHAMQNSRYRNPLLSIDEVYPAVIDRGVISLSRVARDRIQGKI